MYKDIIHYGIHFIVPVIVALLFFKKQWKYALGIMLLGMLIDLDHLLATPIFAPNRCSINFHPLHSYYAIIVYIALLIPKKTRIIGLGLVIHIIADFTDCMMMT
ncbi:DUF6122 family protein [Olleya sp. Hel_I_94]|jgi:hypothetical protein|uniref:DUF6122 family protein n=1 Tax=Olleya sp. Hel_I_94 TaxID=1250001 RepID=UPI0011A23B91|nr:DUF6122 family protein [Olleya sp. Hel_I_94]TVZ47157.1 hypothetical protein JM82_1749 [Olleya sp. Hel_I_94]|tara:strand:+ start:223766 stop:224077 length:312 start_codon:yes stop_codon:yes gene_type:complete